MNDRGSPYFNHTAFSCAPPANSLPQNTNGFVQDSSYSPPSIGAFPQHRPSYGGPADFMTVPQPFTLTTRTKKNNCRCLTILFVTLTIVFASAYVVYSIFLSKGKDIFKEVVSFSENAYTIDDASKANFSMVDENANLAGDAPVKLLFPSITDPATLAPGKVIVSTAVKDVAPYGVLRKITQRNVTENGIEVETENASLQDAFNELSLRRVVDAKLDAVTNDAKGGFDYDVITSSESTNRHAAGTRVYSEPVIASEQVQHFSSYVLPDSVVHIEDEAAPVRIQKTADEGSETSGVRLSLTKRGNITINGQKTPFEINLDTYFGFEFVYETEITNHGEDSTRIGVRTSLELEYAIKIEVEIIDLCVLFEAAFPSLVEESDVMVDMCKVNLFKASSLFFPTWFLPMALTYGVNLEAQARVTASMGAFGSVREVKEQGVIFYQNKPMETYSMKRPEYPRRTGGVVNTAKLQPGVALEGRASIGLSVFADIEPFGLIGPSFQVMGGVDIISKTVFIKDTSAASYNSAQMFLRAYVAVSSEGFLKKLLSSANIELVAALEIYRWSEKFFESTTDLSGNSTLMYVDVCAIVHGVRHPYKNIKVSGMGLDNNLLAECETDMNGICSFNLLQSNAIPGAMTLLALTDADDNPITHTDSGYTQIANFLRPDMNDMPTLMPVINDVATPMVMVKAPEGTEGKFGVVGIDGCVPYETVWEGLVPADREIAVELAFEDHDNSGVVLFPKVCNFTVLGSGTGTSCKHVLLYRATTTLDIVTCNTDPHSE